MPGKKQELRPVIDRVKEIKEKADAAHAANTEGSGWEDAIKVGSSEVVTNTNTDTLVVGKVETLSNGPQVVGVTDDLVNLLSSSLRNMKADLKEDISQNNIRVMQEIKEVKETLDTVQSALTKVVVLLSQKNGHSTGEAEEMDPYTKAVDEVRVGLNYLKTQGTSRFKFQGNGPSIMNTLIKKGFSIPNAEEFKSVLRGTPGFTYHSTDDSFEYEGK